MERPTDSGTGTLPTPPSAADPQDPHAPVPVVRTGLTGVLMGLANLVPGVSGGTMVLIMGLYPTFVDAVAGVSRGQVTRRGLLFLGVLAGVAVVTIVAFSGLMSSLVRDHRMVMFSLFLGMTLGGTPVLLAMMRPVRWPAVVALVAGLAVLLGLALSQDESAQQQARDLRAQDTFRPQPAYTFDVAGGALAMSAMVLPGISGAHMLLVLGRYEHVTQAVGMAPRALLGRGQEGDLLLAVGIIAPVVLGAVLSVVLVSNVLKWLLRRYEPTMAGLLLGVLWGSAAAIWPFHRGHGGGEYLLGFACIAAGFVGVLGLSWWQPRQKPKVIAEPVSAPRP